MNRLLDLEGVRKGMEDIKEIEETFQENTANEIISRLSQGGFSGSEDVLSLLDEYNTKCGDLELLTHWWGTDGTREGLVRILDKLNN